MPSEETLVTRLTRLRARLGELPTRLGIPQYQPVVIEYPVGTFTVLAPNPRIDPISPRKIGSFLSEAVQVLGDELVLSGIPRTVSEELLSKGRYLLDATQTETGWTGTKARAVYLDRSQTLTYSVTLVQRRG